MNKVTLSVAAMAVIAPVHAQAEELSQEQKDALIAQKKEAIEGLRQKLTQVTNFIQANCLDVREEWLLNISYIQKDLENDYNNDEKLELTDEEKALYEGRIGNAKTGAVEAQKPYTASKELKAEYATLKSLYDAKVAQCDNGRYPNVGADKKAALQAVGVEAIGAQIEGYDLTKQDIVNDKTTISNNIKAATSSINNIMKNIDAEETAIANNETAYQAVKDAYNAAKDVFNKQIQEAIAKLPRPVYENWQNDAIEKLNTLFRTIEAANKSNESLYADKKCPTWMNENINAIMDAQGRIENVVSGYVALMEIEEKAKADADTELQRLQSALDAIKTELSKRNLTECDADIEAVQASINKLSADINTHYSNRNNNLSKFNYKETVTDITNSTNSIDDNKGHGYAKVISNYEYYNQTLAPAVEVLQADLDAKRDAAAAAKSKDGLYDAATYYAPYYNTTNDLISKLRNNAKNAFKGYTAETYHKGIKYSSEARTINNNINTYAKETGEALTAYNKAVDYSKAQQTLLDALNAQVTDDAVSLNGTFPVIGETYAQAIANIQSQINAINAKVTKAKGQTNTTHKTTLADAADDVVTYDIAKLTSQYTHMKSEYDKNAAINAADAVLAEAQNRINAFQALIDGVLDGSDYGNQTDVITTEKTRIQGLLTAVQTKKTDAENTYTKTKNNDRADNSIKQDAAAAAIASLAEVKDALNNIETPLNALDAAAKAAVTNKAAYDAIKTVIADAQATLVDVLDNTVNPQAQSAAYKYYRQQMNQKKSNLNQVTTDTEASYAAIKADADKETLIARANAISEAAKEFGEAVLVNENTFANQWADVENLQSTWTTVYNTISEKDLSDEAKNYLQRLATFQQDINTLKNTTVPGAFTKGNAKAKDDEIQAEIKRIYDEVIKIGNESKDNYDANVDATNAAQHNNFLSVYETANTTFSDAIKTLNKFSAIKNDALKTALDNLIEYHDLIYAYADKLRNLKSDENKDYGKYVKDVTDGEDDIYDAKKWVDDANMYDREIKALILEYQDLVNKAAVTAFDETIKKAEGEVTWYKRRIEKFTYSGKDNAYKDVEDVIAEAKTAGAIDQDGTVHVYDKDYAVNVDTWMVTLDNNLYSMLYEDFGKACDAEKDKLVGAVTTVYDTEREAIDGFAEIDNDKYLAQLDELKAKTIDVAVNGYRKYSEDNIIKVVKHNCDAYYGSDADASHSDIYTEAYNLSAGNIANFEAYDSMDSTLNERVADFNIVVNKVNKLIVAHQAGSVNTLINTIKNELESKRSDIETWKKEGSCVSNKDIFNSFNSEVNRDGYPQLIDNLKTITIEDEKTVLNAIIDEVKEEYNQAAKENLDAVKDYDAKITKLYNDVAAITRFNNKGVDKFDDACKSLLTLEGNIAQINNELNAMYENTRIAEAVEAVDEAVSHIEPIMAQAEDWADYNDATRALYEELVQGLRGEFELVKADFDSKKENGQILIYKDNILFDLETIKNAVPGYGSELHNEYNKQLDNNNRYQWLNTLLTQAENDLEESYGRIKDFTYRKSYYGQDLINDTYNNLKWNMINYREELEQGYKDVTLAGEYDLSNNINGLSSSIVNMETDATHYEAQGMIEAVRGSLNESIALKNTLNYGGSRAADLQDEYNRINGLAGKARDYNNDAKDNSISYDIDGNDCRIWVDWMGGYSEIRVNYLEEAWPTLQTRIATLQADAEKFAKNVVELAYILGDADNDKRVTVNDYSEVRGWILSATKFEDVSEAKRYGGDVNGDGEFTVADMTGISNLIFHGEVDWTPARVSARMRAAADATDQLTLTSEGEETTLFGKTVRMALNVENVETFTAGQLDITLPQGMKIAAQSLSDRANGHELLANDLGNGTVRMVASTVENNAFTGHNGALIYIDVEVGSDYNGGQIAIDNVIFSDAKANSYYLSKNAPILPTGVEGIQAATMKERIYSVGGQMLKAVKKGVNIIKGENGTKKVISNK